jgi:hypothetical protein
MAEQLYGLTAEDVARLHVLLREFESGALHGKPRHRVQRLGPYKQQFFLAKTGSAIAARSGTTPGSGTVTLYRINDAGTLESMGVTKMAYNITSAEVAADTYIGIELDSTAEQRWIVVVEDCGA